MTTEFLPELRERSQRLTAGARKILAVASDALDEIGVRSSDTPGAVPRRFIAPAMPQWESPMLAVFPGRLALGSPGAEQFQPPAYGDGVWALHSVTFTVLLVTDGVPLGANTRAPLDAKQYEVAAERLMGGIYAIFLGLIEAHETDQLDSQFRPMVVGPADAPAPPAVGFAGMTLAVPYQLF